MPEAIEKTEDGLTAVNYKISNLAKQGLEEYAKANNMALRNALAHILECVGRDHSIIPKPTQYTAKFDLGSNGGTVSIATCSVCQEPFSPAVNGTAIEDLIEWVNGHNEKHAKKG